jgi:hypothetical protein
MKVYTPSEPPYLMRINIKKQGEQTEFITLCETTQEEAFNFIKGIIEKQSISPFVKGRVTNVEIREAKGSQNGKSISLSFKGLEPKEVYSLILKHIEDEGKIN